MKEEEIRPRGIFDEYLRLAAEDTITFFADVERIEGGCPACGGNGHQAFSKENFTYDLCESCHTLYVNPRPVASAFAKYYIESPSSKYWASTFYRETAEARREKLWKPKAQVVAQILSSQGDAQGYAVVDIGGGYGLFAEEIRKLVPFPPVVVEPGPHLASVCREKNLQVIEKFLEDVLPSDLPAVCKAFVSFELFEHLHDPVLFLSHLQQLMSPGDLFIFTTLSGAGVDIQALWEQSKSIMPPHHLNFFNPVSVQILLKRIGLEVLAVTTPGKLDIDILANNMEHIKDRFWRTFVSTASDSEKQRWQEWISSSGWSSHMMVVCRKPLN